MLVRFFQDFYQLQDGLFALGHFVSVLQQDFGILPPDAFVGCEFVLAVLHF